MKRSGKILILLFTLIAALLICVGVHALLHGRAEAKEAAREEAAFTHVFPDTVSFDKAIYNESFLKRYLADNGFPEDQVVVNRVTLARNEERVAKGIVATVSVYKKYGGIISMLVGVQNDGTVNGYEILKISEAKGLDTKVKDPEFAAQFQGVKTDSFTLVTGEVKLQNEILSAAGAEDASQAVVLGVNAAVRTISFIDEVYGGLLNG